jgi:DNA primase
LEETKNDPIKKAELIRDIVASISKIPNNIQKEIYVQECARIMNISESVLFNELSQNLKREQRDAAKKRITSKSPFTGVKKEIKKIDKVDRLMVLEESLIGMLLLYGNNEVDFIDFVTEIEEDGKMKINKEKYTNTVSNEIYVNLQEDEIKFTNPVFLKIYYEIINRLNQDQLIDIELLTHHEDVEIAAMVTNILMDDEKYNISDWGRHNIFPKTKVKDLPKLVPDVIYNLRMFLVKELIGSIMGKLNPDEQNEDINISNKELLNEVNDYNGLRTILAEKLNRVV